MKKIALVICCEKDKKADVEKNIFLLIIKKIKEFIKSFNKEELFKNAVNSHLLLENTEIFVITLPYDIIELAQIGKRRIRQINAFLHEIYNENSLECILLPEKINCIHQFENCIRNPFNGVYLYKSLLENIIDDIFTERGIKTWELDITIIQGQSREEVYRVINLLSPRVRYLTVISEEREMIEEEAGESFLDSGLSIIITEDYKSAFKSADLIINLDCKRGIIENVKTKSETVIINFGCIEPTKILGNNILINGIDVRMPYKVSKVLGSNIFNYFNRLELAEVMILHNTEVHDLIDETFFPDLEHIKLVSKIFKKEGYSISGFAGRRNIFNMKGTTKKEVEER